jgi:hypothetical protein
LRDFGRLANIECSITGHKPFKTSEFAAPGYPKQREPGLKRKSIMTMNHIGKFEMRKILNDFDATLINLFGVNMLDADISRIEAVNAYNEFQCAQKAAEVSGLRRGFNLQSVQS